ncbi:MAG: RdgB/HAM1 family non-canonical purine NTP pyrophosphatase [Eubacterium sp.]|nr:RdgB/HAM1 family non-canonical purine NTP pyrophosphatase [Eubacterium sp.]
MYHIIFATGNAGKMKEIRQILADPELCVYAMKEFGLDPEIDENGKTFAENAAIKARTVADVYRSLYQSAGAEEKNGLPAPEKTVVMADDSGLVIDYLNGEPGIYSARYMGEDTSYRIKNANLIGRLEGVPDAERTARFVCAIAAAMPDGTLLEADGTIEGQIGYEERGANGFGYDPIFFLPERGCTTAELTPDEKDAVSHRGKALRKIKALLHDRVS